MSKENKKSRFQWIVDAAIDKGEINGYKYYMCNAPHSDAINGYIVFPKKPVREDGYKGILSYVPVHGGITFCEHDVGQSIYGFDTVHYDSHEYPRTDKEWIKGQITIMLNGILKAAEVEQKYLRCVSNEGKAKWAQLVQDLQPEQSNNFGVMLNILSGKL